MDLFVKNKILGCGNLKFFHFFKEKKLLFFSKINV
jgi:hypothetical protein